MDSIYKDRIPTTVTPLFATGTTHATVTKVGVLPLLLDDKQAKAWRVLMMKPRAKKSFPAESLFQIPKGTRRIFLPEGARDMRLDDLEHYADEFYEPLLDTALREGAEEVGLKKENIGRLWDAGVHYFSSASTGKRRQLHMFVADIKDQMNFDPFEASTEESGWLEASDLAAMCRPDHIIIIENIMEQLKKTLLNN